MTYYWNNTRCYRLLSTVSCPPVAVRGGVSDRVAAAAPVWLACASRSLGRLALVAPTCLPAAASVSIYTILSRYTLTTWYDTLSVLVAKGRARVSVAASEADWSKRIREMQYADYEDHTVGS